MAAPDAVAEVLHAMTTADGAYANDSLIKTGTTAATAAAVSLARSLGFSPRSGLGDWFVSRCFREGGFLASPQAPLPDLLSTATALHALSGLEFPLERIQEPC